MPIDISWEEGAPPPELSESTLREALAVFLARLDCPQSGLSLLMAGDARLRDLNKNHRGLDRPTDVLAWRYPEGDGPRLLGEIALSLERAHTQARENGWTLPTEVLRLLAHGCAHLAGHDHQTAEQEQAMLAVEAELLDAVGLNGIYPKGEA